MSYLYSSNLNVPDISFQPLSIYVKSLVKRPPFQRNIMVIVLKVLPCKRAITCSMWGYQQVVMCTDNGVMLHMSWLSIYVCVLMKLTCLQYHSKWMDIVYSQIKISYTNFVFLIVMCPRVSSLMSFLNLYQSLPI